MLRLKELRRAAGFRTQQAFAAACRSPSPIGTILIKNSVYSFPDAQGRLLNPEALHTNHYATCPAAAQWSRRPARQKSPDLAPCSGGVALLRSHLRCVDLGP
jgi:hypothetical protein